MRDLTFRRTVRGTYTTAFVLSDALPSGREAFTAQICQINGEWLLQTFTWDLILESRWFPRLRDAKAAARQTWAAVGQSF